MKGRKTLKVYKSKHLTRAEKEALVPLSKARIAAGDESYSKFLQDKPRADPHFYSHYVEKFYLKDDYKPKSGHGHGHDHGHGHHSC